MIREINLETGEEIQRDYTPEELAAIEQSKPDPRISIQTEIDRMEREQMMPRATREFMLLFMETQFPAEALAANPGYQAVKAFDEAIKALREQL